MHQEQSDSSRWLTFDDGSTFRLAWRRFIERSKRESLQIPPELTFPTPKAAPAIHGKGPPRATLQRN
jgi:hypothetical protein